MPEKQSKNISYHGEQLTKLSTFWHAQIGSATFVWKSNEGTWFYRVLTTE